MRSLLGFREATCLMSLILTHGAYLRRCLTAADNACPAVLLYRDRLHTRSHALAVQQAAQVVDLVVDEPGQAVGEPRQVSGAVEAAVSDEDAQRARHESSDIEEAQAAFVLLVLVLGCLGDVGVQQHDGLCPSIGWEDDGGRSGRSRSGGGGDAHALALAERVKFSDASDCVHQRGDDLLGLFSLGGQVEGTSGEAEDGVAVLDDAGIGPWTG